MYLYQFAFIFRRGLGDAATPLWGTAASTVVNLALHFLFMSHYGWGVLGAGWAVVGCKCYTCYHVCDQSESSPIGLPKARFCVLDCRDEGFPPRGLSGSGSL